MLLYSCAAIFLLSFVLPAAWIEALFSKGLFPVVQAVLVPGFGWLPFPVMGTLLVLLPIGLCIFGWRRWRAARRNDSKVLAILGAGSLRGLRLALYAYTCFLLLWGFGYRRVPIETRWNLGSELPEYSQAKEVQERLLALIHRDCPVDQPDEMLALQSVLAAELKLVEQMEGWTPELPAQVKHPPTGWFFAIGILGIISPFTLEAHVEKALPPPIRIGVSSHEVAHLLGYCGEADANLVSFVAGLQAEDSYARYSTALTMLTYTNSLVHRGDFLWLYSNLPERAQADLKAWVDASRRYKIESLNKLTTDMNDVYLRSQGVKLGHGDYSRGYTLFVSAWAKGLVELPAPYKER